ncbi:hypothetical protein ABPG73_015390 [Tetrahymena malaccensis]
MNKFVANIFVACFVFTLSQAHQQKHICAHEIMNEQLDQEIVDFIVYENDRNLQSTDPRNLKITYDMAYFSNLSNNLEIQTFRSYCEKSIIIASNFFSNLITIVPKPAGSMKWDSKSDTCGKATVPSVDKATDKDSDLHLYITFSDNPQETYLAYAGWCRSLISRGPTHGHINFNFGLLKSFNFTDSLQFQKKSFYGKDAGCSFVTGSCDGNKREFCHVGSQEKNCDYYYQGFGQCKSSIFLDENCQIYDSFSYPQCFDDSNNFQIDPTFKNALGVSFGPSSKCFNSSLIKSTNRSIQKQGICYNYICTDAYQVIVDVGGTKVTCSNNGEQLQVVGYSGILTCPEKLDQFCSFNKLCPNNCNSNGFCNNGTCICMNGFKGTACDQAA